MAQRCANVLINLKHGHHPPTVHNRYVAGNQVYINHVAVEGAELIAMHQLRRHLAVAGDYKSGIVALLGADLRPVGGKNGDAAQVIELEFGDFGIVHECRDLAVQPGLTGCLARFASVG